MVSVVVPVLDEARLLPAFLADLAPRVRRIGGELLVVDGGSSDGSDRIADAHEHVTAITGDRGRGAQMNRGAAAAAGSLLVFVPADTRLGPGTVRRLAEIDLERRPEAGGFRSRFDTPRPFLRAISAMHNLRARMTGVIYGDQVPFMRRELFEQLGGFSTGDMEDVELGTRLRRLTRARLQPQTAVTSPRRFDRAGDLRATADAARLLAGWQFRRRVGRSRIFFDEVR